MKTSANKKQEKQKQTINEEHNKNMENKTTQKSKKEI